MEPISAGASVLAFVVLALDGTKGLYQLITGFKRATRETRAIAAAIQNLHNVLLQFETSPVLNRPATELNDIVRILSACHQDLTRFQHDIEEFQLGSSGSRGRRVLHNLKRPFFKPELDSIRQSISDYHGALHIRLGIVNSTMLQACKDGIQGLHDTTEAGDLKTSTILDNVENIKTSVRTHTDRIAELRDISRAGNQQVSTIVDHVQIVKSSVEDHTNRITSLQNATMAGNMQAATVAQNVQSVKLSVEDHAERIRGLQDTVMTGVQQTCTLIQDVQSMRSSVEDQLRNMAITSTSAIDRSAAYSASQLDSILTAFRTLQEQFMSLPDQLAIAQGKPAQSQVPMPPCPSSAQATNEDMELKNSLERLQRLGSCDPRTLFDEEAKMIIDDLGRILSALSIFENKGLSSSIQDPTYADLENGITASDMDRVRSLVSLAGGVAVNQGPTRFATAKYKRITQERWKKELGSGNRNTTIRINKRRLQRANNHSRQDRLRLYSHDEEFYVTIKTIVKDTHCPYVLTAYIGQFKQQHGFSSFNPVVSVGNILPGDSPIFKAVVSGDVDGLRQILARGEGTLRDRDYRGTPLLHYATSRANRAIKHQMCKFLIENGADLDEVAPLALHERGHWLCTPLESVLQGTENLEEDAERIHSFRSLLAAGADPTYDALNSCLESSEGLDCLRLILDNPIPFVDLEDRDIDGNTPLLRVAARAVSLLFDWRILNSLLTSGANIHARSLDNANCLEVLIKSLFYYKYPRLANCLEIQKSLILLIHAGADVHSVDSMGNSIFDIVYIDCQELCYSYLGDIWDSVLSICGYDIRQVRKRVHRVAAYRTFRKVKEVYTREDFELLWAGREEFCPYYHDPTIWCPSSTSPSGGCPYGGTGHLCPGPEGISIEEPHRCRHCDTWDSADFETDEFEEDESETDDIHGGGPIITLDGGTDNGHPHEIEPPEVHPPRDIHSDEALAEPASNNFDEDNAQSTQRWHDHHDGQRELEDTVSVSSCEYYFEASEV